MRESDRFEAVYGGRIISTHPTKPDARFPFRIRIRAISEKLWRKWVIWKIKGKGSDNIEVFRYNIQKYTFKKLVNIEPAPLPRGRRVAVHSSSGRPRGAE